MKHKNMPKSGKLRPKGLKRPVRPKGLKPMTDEQKRDARFIDMDRLKDPRPPRGLKRSEEDNKKMIKMKRGGRMGAPKDLAAFGRFNKKMEKITPLAPKKIDSAVSMDKTLKKSAVEVDNKKKRRRKRRKLENGGKVKRTANVNLRGEGKKKNKPKGKGYVLAPMNTAGPGKAKKDMPFVRGRSEGFGSVGPTMEDYIRGERMARANMEKVTPRGPDVIGLSQKVKPGTIKKSSAKIPVPAKKKRRIRRRK